MSLTMQMIASVKRVALMESVTEKALLTVVLTVISRHNSTLIWTCHKFYTREKFSRNCISTDQILRNKVRLILTNIIFHQNWCDTPVLQFFCGEIFHQSIGLWSETWTPPVQSYLNVCKIIRSLNINLKRVVLK